MVCAFLASLCSVTTTVVLCDECLARCSRLPSPAAADSATARRFGAAQRHQRANSVASALLVAIDVSCVVWPMDAAASRVCRAVFASRAMLAISRRVRVARCRTLPVVHRRVGGCFAVDWRRLWSTGASLHRAMRRATQCVARSACARQATAYGARAARYATASNGSFCALFARDYCVVFVALLLCNCVLTRRRQQSSCRRRSTSTRL